MEIIWIGQNLQGQICEIATYELFGGFFDIGNHSATESQIAWMAAMSKIASSIATPLDNFTANQKWSAYLQVMFLKLHLGLLNCQTFEEISV